MRVPTVVAEDISTKPAVKSSGVVVVLESTNLYLTRVGPHGQQLLDLDLYVVVADHATFAEDAISPKPGELRVVRDDERVSGQDFLMLYFVAIKPKPAVFFAPLAVR